MTMLAPLQAILARTGHDALVLVPGANFRRIFRKDFHQMERPLAIARNDDGEPVAIVPNLELGSFKPIGFPGKIFDWRDEVGYMDAFMAAGSALGQLRAGARIGVEGQRMRVFDLFALQKALPGATFHDIHGEISSIRLHKTADEIALQRRAIEISEAALEATLQELREGMTETEIESILLRNLFSHGADGLAFAPIVAAGDNSAKPHAHARPDYRIKAGDALLFDFGGSYQGYSADITRSFFVKQVSDYDRAFYETVLAANAKGREISRAGITASEVDDAVQVVLEQSQFATFRRHKTGHGLGLDVHEAPQIMRGNTQVLEPGLYREGEAGIRIEDDVVVTEDGIQCLTTFSRELRLVG
jgi:Xaa-Pro dipeptidase